MTATSLSTDSFVALSRDVDELVDLVANFHFHVRIELYIYVIMLCYWDHLLSLTLPCKSMPSPISVLMFVKCLGSWAKYTTSQAG